MSNTRIDFTRYDEEREHSMADEGGMSGAQLEGEPMLRLVPPPPGSEPKPALKKDVSLREAALLLTALAILALSTYRRAYRKQR